MFMYHFIETGGIFRQMGLSYEQHLLAATGAHPVNVFGVDAFLAGCGEQV